MSILDTAREKIGPKGPTGYTIPRDVDDRTRRGRKDMLRDAPKRRLCMRFERGDTYWYINGKGLMGYQPTVTNPNGSGKPDHRIRNKYNFIRPIVQAKVSAATQRIPSYDIAPSTTDPSDEGAARLSEQVALYGYDKWRLRSVAIKVVTMAIGHGGDGFAMPYFDPDVGPYTLVDGEQVGQGEIKVLTLSGNEVYWESGVDFMDSPWHAIERARPVEEVRQLPGYIGGELGADAVTSDVPTDRDGRENLAIVTEYLERPSPKYPDGRRLIMAGGRIIVDNRLIEPNAAGPWEDYPLKGADGVVLDEPCLHRLSYTQDPELDRDFGLTWQLIDFQRTAQDAMNKAVEWKNRCLVPQMTAPVGSIVSPRTDAPGDIVYFRPVGGLRPEWEPVNPIPDSLFTIKREMQADMAAVAQDINLDDLSNSAARNTQQLIEQSANRWQSFLGDLAEWHSRLMRHCLVLVGRHYTEPRLLQVRGRYGAYPVQDFKGAQLLGQVSVRVNPGSLAVRSHEQVTAQIMSYAQLGWIDGQTAMAAIQGGTAEKLVEGYELSVGRANRIIQKIRDGSIMDMPSLPMTDPTTGAPLLDATGQPQLIPAWMPRDYDKPEIWKHVLSDFLQTEEFEKLPEEMQTVGQTIYDGILKTQADQQMRAAMAQTQQAESLGMANAAGPQGAKQMPSLPGSDITPAPGQAPSAP